jgi:hypothetical protein
LEDTEAALHTVKLQPGSLLMLAGGDEDDDADDGVDDENGEDE